MACLPAECVGIAPAGVRFADSEALRKVAFLSQIV